MQKEKLPIIEKIAVILIILIALIGIVFDVCVYNGCVYWIVSDLREFTMTVLQIQAGVSTLAVAVLALISGMSGHEMYGDRKSTRLNSSHPTTSRMPSSA